MNLTDYPDYARTKVCLFGPPKSGKTALAGKLASEGFKLKWFDLESGIKTLLNPAMLPPSARQNIQVFNLPDHRMYPVALDTLRAVLRGGKKRICDAHGKVSCPLCAKDAAAKHSEINVLALADDEILVIDSGTQLAASALSKVTLKELSKPGGEEYKPTWDDYSAQGALMNELLSLVQVLNVNIIIISHEVDVEKAENKTKIVPTMGTRNFSNNCAKFFDVTVYCSVLNKSHRANCSSTYSPAVVTGSRLPTELDKLQGAELSLASLFRPQ